MQLSSGEFDALSNCFDQNYFLELPKNIRTNRTDGSSVDAYLATNDQFKFIESYMSDNIVFNKLSKTLISTLEKQKSKEVPFTAFINDCKKCVQTYQQGSPEFKCTEKFLHDLYFEYSAYGKAKEDVKLQFVSILGETVEGLQEKHLQEKNAKYDREEALNKQAPNAANLIAQSGELLSGAQKITAGAPLKGQSSTPQVDLQNLSQWWKRSSELSSLLTANSRYVNKLRSVTSKTLNFCTVQELVNHASSWLNKSVEYTMAGDNKNARLYQKAASMAVVAATEVAAGRFPTSMSLGKSSVGTSLGECKYTYHYEDKGGKFVPVKNKIDPNGFESVQQVLVYPSFLPKGN